MKNDHRTIAWRLSLLLALAVTVSIGIAALQGRPAYDTKESIAKLTAIGKSLQIYRKYHPAKPVADRKTYEDAGLPESLTDLAEPGHPWSLPNGMATFHVSNPTEIYAQNPVSFNQMYWSSTDSLHLPDMSAYYTTRGEKMPVLADENPNGFTEMATPGLLQTDLVLRLDGSVEMVHFQRTGFMCVLGH